MDQRFLIAAMICVIITVIMVVASRRGKQRDQAAESIDNGRYTTGFITAVKCPTMFDQSDKRRSDIKVHLEYRNPTSGAVNLVTHTLDKHSNDLPPSIIDPTGSEPDGNGFISFEEPVPVDVYLYSAAPSGDGIYIVFNKRLQFRDYLRA